jgi:hypothetical protein
MYGKIFESMYKGTLYGQWEAIVTFQQLIVLCDSDGIVDMTPPAIAATTSIPLDIIHKGIEALEQVDQYSRSPAHEGRRIVLLDPARPWGWQIVNHDYYRNLASKEDKREKDRARISEKRNQINDVADCRNLSQKVANVAHTNTDANTNTDTYTKIDREVDKPPPKPKFSRPTIVEIREYCQSIGASINPVTFFNHYETVGWKVGKNPMKDWKAAVRGWNSRDAK